MEDELIKLPTQLNECVANVSTKEKSLVLRYPRVISTLLTLLLKLQREFSAELAIVSKHIGLNFTYNKSSFSDSELEICEFV